MTGCKDHGWECTGLGHERVQAFDGLGNAKREIAYLTELAGSESQSPAVRVRALLTVHQRRDVGSCLCGWDKLGQSFAGHQAEVLYKAGLLKDLPACGQPDCEHAPDGGNHPVVGQG